MCGSAVRARPGSNGWHTWQRTSLLQTKQDRDVRWSDENDRVTSEPPQEQAGTSDGNIGSSDTPGAKLRRVNLTSVVAWKGGSQATPDSPRWVAERRRIEVRRRMTRGEHRDGDGRRSRRIPSYPAKNRKDDALLDVEATASLLVTRTSNRDRPEDGFTGPRSVARER